MWDLGIYSYQSRLTERGGSRSSRSARRDAVDAAAFDAPWCGSLGCKADRDARRKADDHAVSFVRNAGTGLSGVCRAGGAQADGPKRDIPAHRLAPWGRAKACFSTREQAAARKPPGVVITSGSVARGFREASRHSHCVRNAGRVRCFRGDDTRVLSNFCTRGCGRIVRPAFRAPSQMRER